jgi:hypothetical protein
MSKSFHSGGRQAPQAGPRIPWFWNERWAAGASFLVLLAGWGRFALLLGRYPQPYFDEGVYNVPAIRAAEGRGFAWSMSPQAPFGQTIWAYHGPFFPRLQAVMFRLFGVSQFICRFPQSLCTLLALCLLCALLIKTGYRWAALGLAVVWLGDRSSLEILYGRMEGIAFLLLAVSFVSLVYFFRHPSPWCAAVTALPVATAVGFHPATLIFLAGVALAVFAYAPRAKRLKTWLSFALGAALPFLAMGWMYAGHFSQALQQFMWHQRIAVRGTKADNLRNLIRVLSLSRYWALALGAIAIFVLLPFLVRCILLNRNAPASPYLTIPRLASLYSVLGLAVVCSVSSFPYYLIYFTVWPVIAVLALCEHPAEKASRRVAVGALLLATLAWLPSLFYNTMRCREAWLYYRALDTSAFVARISAVVPREEFPRVLGSPEWFIAGRPINPDFARPPLARADELPADAWLVISGEDLRRLGGLPASGLSTRPVAYQGGVYPDWKWSETMLILGPLPKHSIACSRSAIPISR